jgi:hypothetical protein
VKLELLTQMDKVLSKCGRPVLPGGITCVTLEKKILMPMVLSPNTSVTFSKEIPGDTIWCLRAISSDQGMNSQVGIRVQIQFPNGRFLFGGNGQDIGQFAWVGSYRFPIDPEMDFEPGGKFKVTLTDTGGLNADKAVNLVFEGCYKYYLRGGELVPDAMKLASSLPRYQGTVNENILAPCWLTGAQPAVPDGYVSHDLFTYSSDVFTFTVPGVLQGQLTIPIDEGYDFFCRRILVDFQFVAGNTFIGTAIVLAKVRTGTGYALNDDWIDFGKYLCGAEWPKDWKIRGRDAVIVDLQFADDSGSGDATYQVHLEGVRRKKP